MQVIHKVNVFVKTKQIFCQRSKEGEPEFNSREREGEAKQNVCSLGYFDRQEGMGCQSGNRVAKDDEREGHQGC